MFNRMTQAPIRLRLPLLVVCALLASIIVMSYVYYLEFKKVQMAQAENLSATIAESASESLETWFDYTSLNVDAYAKSRTTGQTLRGLAEALNGGQDAARMAAIRQSYVEDNPFPVGERENLDNAGEDRPFDDVHAQLHFQFRNIVNRNGYYDLFLILPNGFVAYTVEKEEDFGRSLESGPYANSGLAKAYRRALEADPNSSVFVDFEPYAPSAQAPASFMAQKVVDENGDILGVVAIQLPMEAIQANLSKSLGLGPRDEIYLVGLDGMARSVARQSGLLSVLGSVPASEQVVAARNGVKQFFDEVTGIRGDAASVFVKPTNLMGTTWSIVVELDRDQAYAALDAFVWRALLLVAAGAVVSMIGGYALAASITRPLHAFATSMEEISNDNYVAVIAALDRKDEIGTLSRLLQGFKDKLIISREASAHIAEKRQEQSDVVAALGSGLQGLAAGDLSVRLETQFPDEYEGLRHNFNATIDTMNELIRMIVENATEIHARAEEISLSSDDLSHRTESQAATLEQTAAALDELTASVREAAESASEVERVVSGARKDAEESGQVVSEAVEAMSMIRKSSNEISQIIGVIDDIAFQTNLLSLNAGVEAARAGDAGRGFAVVASEVRALAQRSSEAAKKIKSLITSSSEQVETGVGLVGRTGDALGSIITRVSDIDNLVSGIATGSREQSVGLGEINVGMAQLDQVTQQNAAMVEQATAAATTLKNEAATLSQTVSRFKLEEWDQAMSQESEIIQFRSASARANPVPASADANDDTFVAARSEFAVGAGSWKDF